MPRSLNAVDANARLTAATGLVLLVLLPVEGVTLLSLRALLTVHMLVGVALIPPIALKLASTGYRFMPASSSDSGRSVSMCSPTCGASRGSCSPTGPGDVTASSADACGDGLSRGRCSRAS